MKIFTALNILVFALLFLFGFFSTNLLADNGPAHKVEQSWPIDLGTSGGNINDRSFFYCCSGTLGSLVKDSSGAKYILSNNHILARTNRAVIGDDVSHPGLIDNSCVRDFSEVVADLSKFKTISFTAGTTNQVDAAIARIRSGAVDTSGEILDIGPVSGSIITSPQIGMSVKKSGRTTGLTTGTISAVGVTIDIFYPTSCGSSSTRKARFTNQIMIEPGNFSKGGDSGSLIVENVLSCPRAVGLLFAGNGVVTIANPIGDALSILGVSMVGGCTAGEIQEEKSIFDTMFAWLFPSARADHIQLLNPSDILSALKVKKLHDNSLFALQGVVGTGVGVSGVARGQAVIEVYVKELTDEVIRNIPTRLDGLPVEIVETGEIIAF